MKAYTIDQVNEALKLADHIIAMAYDPYLNGHPEWEEMVKRAEFVTKEPEEI